MKKNNLPFSPPSDLLLLHKILFYFSALCPCLPHPRLKDHCRGVIASVYELLVYLESHNFADYGNNPK